MTHPFLPNAGDATYQAQAEPDSLDFDVIIAATNKTGVISGCAVSESDPQAQTVDVASGSIMIAGTVYSVSTQADVSVTAAHATLPRIDVITVNSSGTAVVVAGTANANPVAPTVSASAVVLAFLYIAANDNTHANVQLSDKRAYTDAYLKLTGGTLSGYLTLGSASGLVFSSSDNSWTINTSGDDFNIHDNEAGQVRLRSRDNDDLNLLEILDTSGAVQYVFSSTSLNMGGNAIINSGTISSYNNNLSIRAQGSTAAPQNLTFATDDAGGVLRTRILIDGDGVIYFYKSDGTGNLTLGNGEAQFDVDINMVGNSIKNVVFVGDTVTTERIEFDQVSTDILFYDNVNAVTFQWDESEDRWEFNKNIDMDGGPGQITGVQLLQTWNNDLLIHAVNSGAAPQNIYLRADAADGAQRTRMFIDGDGTTILYDNTATQRLSITTSGVSINGFLSSATDPTAGSHIGDRDYNDGRYVEIAGDTMSGDLIIDDATALVGDQETSVLHVKHTVNASESTLGEFDPLKPHGGITFLRDWTSTESTLGKIHSYGASNWGGGLIFMTKEGDSSSSSDPKPTLDLAPSGDIIFYKLDGSTKSLIWDESGDRWEFSTNVDIGGNSITSISSLSGKSDGTMYIRPGTGQALILRDDDAHNRFFISSGGDLLFYKDDGTTVSLAWDESDDRWEFTTHILSSGDLLLGYEGTTHTKLGLIHNQGASLELGRADGTTGTPFIDFHTGSDVDYSARILATGDNTTTLGDGGLSVTAKTGLDLIGVTPLLSPKDPTAGHHVGDRDYNDLRYGQLSGFTMAGNLNINGWWLHSQNVTLYLDADATTATSNDIRLRADNASGTLITRILIDGDSNTDFYDNGGTVRFRITTGGAEVVAGDLDMNGGTIEDSRPAGTISAARTLDGTDNVVFATTSSAAYNVTIPLAASYTGKMYLIKRKGATYAVNVVRTSTNTFWKDGTSTYTQIALASEGAAVGLFSDGTNWIVVATEGTVTLT